MLREGKLVSSGSFMMDAHRAIEKLAAYQLVDANWWILKIVQAAVASGSPSLDIEFRDRDIRLFFQPQEPWTYDLVEKALLDPQPDPLPGLQHLKQGLWNCWLHQGHPFQLDLVGEQQQLIGVLGKMQMRTGNCPRTVVTISHRRPHEGFKVLGPLQRQARNIKLALLVRERAGVCSIPMQIDGRIASFYQGWAHEDGSLDETLQLFTVQDESLPVLSAPHIPPLEFLDGPSLSRRLRNVPVIPFQSASGLVKVFYRFKDAPFHRLVNGFDSICWVRDGVWVDSDGLFDSERRCVGVQVFANADDLKTDASGMKLVISPEQTRRCDCLREHVARRLETDTLFSGIRYRNKTRILSVYASTVLASGGLGWFEYGSDFGLGTGAIMTFIGGLIAIPRAYGDWASNVVSRGTDHACQLQIAMNAWRSRHESSRA